MRYQYAKAGARAALLDELAAAGVAVERLEMDDARVWVTTGADEAAVRAVVEAHNPAAYEQAEAQAEQADTDNRGIARLAVAVLEADIARLEDASVTLTVAQLRAHLSRTDKALVAVIRYLQRRGL